MAEDGAPTTEARKSCPPELLQAVSTTNARQIALVLGAGCSLEAPTSLPLARDCSLDAHRKLVQDGILADGDCKSPEDLSELAEVVFQKTGGQLALVERLPVHRFKIAPPNRGYLLAVALLRERVISSIVTLNFDLAIYSALIQLKAHEVSLVRGPEEHSLLGQLNVVFLHRCCFSDPESWVLRKSALELDWKNCWEQIIATSILASPYILFVGLGSPAAVIQESTLRIQASLPEGARHTFQADPAPIDKSHLFEVLALPESSYIQLGWCDLMEELAARFCEEKADRLRTATEAMIRQEHWDAEDGESVCRRAAALTLLGLGKAIARWTLADSDYSPADAIDLRLLGALLATVAYMARSANLIPHFSDDGLVVFKDDLGRIRGVVRLVTGSGALSWGSMEPRLQMYRRCYPCHYLEEQAILVGGVTGTMRRDIAPPHDIVMDAKPDDIVYGAGMPRVLAVDDLRLDGSWTEVFA